MTDAANEVTSYSKESVDKLINELANSKKINSELKTNIDNLNAQFKTQFENLLNELDASKQMYNESLNAHYQLRTQNIALQKKIQAVTQEIEKLKADLSPKE